MEQKKWNKLKKEVKKQLAPEKNNCTKQEKEHLRSENLLVIMNKLLNC